MKMFTDPFQSAKRLAALMRPYPWYHRTSVCDQRPGGDMSRPLTTCLRVWTDVRNPPEIPATFEGYPVEVCFVTEEHPCPFGSVKG